MSLESRAEHLRNTLIYHAQIHCFSTRAQFMIWLENSIFSILTFERFWVHVRFSKKNVEKKFCKDKLIEKKNDKKKKKISKKKK